MVAVIGDVHGCFYTLQNLVEKIRAKYPDIKIIILTSHESEDEVLTALSSGANAYTLKDIEFP